MLPFQIHIHPFWADDSVSRVKFTFCAPAEAIPFTEGQPQLSHSMDAYGGICPFPVYDHLQIRDDLGEIPYHKGPAVSYDNNVRFEGIYLERSCSGTVTWSLSEYPRILPEGYRSSPYYDFRAEPYGLNGVGLFSFILPAVDADTPYEVTYDWDLSDLPEGSRGLLNYGEGTVTKVLSVEMIYMTMFQTGLMHALEEDGFGVYWFEEPYFDVRGVASRLLPIFKYEKQFFRDPDSRFYVFLRRDPFEKSGGGSAVPYAFISGYSAFGGMKEDQWFNVLIHEMTHTWPSMMDRITGEGTWFCEGATEYYCTMIPYWGGYISAQDTAEFINEKAWDRYYHNPYRTCSAEKIAEIQWQQREAQKVPYGRGFIYVANVREQLRRAGKPPLEDLVCRYHIMNPMPVQVWVDFIREQLGEEGVREYEAMMRGELILPLPDLFGPEFQTVEETFELNGETVCGYRWKAGE